MNSSLLLPYAEGDTLTGVFHYSNLSIIIIIKRNIKRKVRGVTNFREPRTIGSIAVLFGVLGFTCCLAGEQSPLTVSVDAHGAYILGAPDKPTLVSGVAAKIDGEWIHSTDYPKHAVENSVSDGYAGSAQQWTDLPGHRT